MALVSADVQDAVKRAEEIARNKRNEILKPEHLLLALTEEPSALEAIKQVGGDIEQLRSSLQNCIDQEYALPPSDFEQVSVTPSASYQRIFQRCDLRAKSSGHSQIQGKDVIVSLLLERYGVAAEALKDQGLVFEGGFMRRLSDAEKHARQQSEYNVEVEAQADLSVHMIPNNIKDAFNRRFLNEVVTSPEFKEEIGRAVLRTAERKLSSGPT